MPHAEDRAVRVRAEAQVGVLAKELERMLFRLDGILLRIAVAEHLHGGHLHLHALAAALALHDHAGATHGGAGGEACTRGGIDLFLVDHALQVADGASIVQGDEAVVAEGAHPAGHGERGAGERTVIEDGLDRCVHARALCIAVALSPKRRSAPTTARRRRAKMNSRREAEGHVWASSPPVEHPRLLV